ncbi:hypothetical protein [Halomonas tibetensis]|uniref:Quinohemoprotein amine dehydrogenase alpha subunit haem binding domain-containing protein n=1 Tax=Halomonas tibetensis TaxID=2259590 RepID=A0ABV7B228_9GAMM
MNIEQLIEEPPSLSEEELAARRDRIARDMQAARERAEAAAAVQAAQRQASLAHEAVRPAGERLIERRCHGCHTPETFESDNLTPLGWRLTLWRMEWWHGVALEPGEYRQLHEALVERSPASRGRALGEVALIISFPLLLVLLTLWRRRRPHS